MSLDDHLKPVVETAKRLWREYRTKKKEDAEWAAKKPSEKISTFHEGGYQEFITKHSVVVRCMMMNDEFNEDAFIKYLLRLKTKGYSSKEEWIERQADYTKYLWRAYNRHGSTREANEYWQQSRERIKNEMQSFEKDYEKAKDRAETKKVECTNFHKQNLKDMIVNDPAMRAKLETIWKNMAATRRVVTEKVEKVEKEPEKEPEKELTPEEIEQQKQERRRLQKKNAKKRHRQNAVNRKSPVPPLNMSDLVAVEVRQTQTHNCPTESASGVFEFCDECENKMRLKKSRERQRFRDKKIREYNARLIRPTTAPLVEESETDGDSDAVPVSGMNCRTAIRAARRMAQKINRKEKTKQRHLERQARREELSKSRGSGDSDSDSESETDEEPLVVVAKNHDLLFG